MNDLAYVFADLLCSPLPLLAPALWLRFWGSLAHLCGEYSARLLRWLLVSGAASAGGGVPRVYYGCAWIPLRKRVGQLAGSFFFVPDAEPTRYIQLYRKDRWLLLAFPVPSSPQGGDSLWRF